MRQVVLIVGTVAAVLLVAAAAVSIWLTGSITGSQDGERIAWDSAAAKAEAMERDFGYQRDKLDAQTIATGPVFTSRPDVMPVAWSGSTRVGDEAIIDVRVRVEIEANSGGFGNGPVVTAGAAERCYRFTLAITHYAQRAEIDCSTLPSTAQALDATLPATPLATLPEDAAPRLEALLRVSDPVAPRELAERIRTEFTDPAFSIDTSLTDDGEWVVALGAAESKSCIVRVLRPDGTVDPVSFDRIQLEPGEGGCRVELYTAPAL